MKGALPGPPPPIAHNFLNFMQFCGKLWQNRRLAPPPRGLAPPPVGGPGSAPEMCVVWIYNRRPDRMTM